MARNETCFKTWVVEPNVRIQAERQRRRKKIMVGTRLLVAGSFALPFGLLTALSIYYGIPRDDLLWKRLEALSFISSPPPGVFPPPLPPSDEDPAIAGLISPGKKPMLVVPTSWTVNEMEQVLYEVTPLSESELAKLCQNHHHHHHHPHDQHDQHHNRDDDDQLRMIMALERQATIVLCRSGVDEPPTTSTKVVARQNYIYLYAKSKREFRQMLQSYDDHSSSYQEPPSRMTMSGGGTRVRLVLDRSDLLHSNWKEITNHLVSWVSLTLPSNSNACRNVDNVSIELDVMDDPNVGQQRTPREMLDLLDDTPIVNNSNNKVILYLTSTDQAQAFHGQLGAVDFCLGPGRYLYIVHDHSTMLAAVRDGFQRIILHDCWNLPFTIDGRDNDEGLQTLYQVFNATMARRMTHQLQEKARWLQYRIDHLHSTAGVVVSSSRRVIDGGGFQPQAVRKLLYGGRLRAAREMVDSVRFGMVPDFPYDQYAAIFAPLLFPLLIPAVLTTFREVKRYRKTRHNTT
jgi:Phosphatidylinositol-glycan biosynthesis class S protein